MERHQAAAGSHSGRLLLAQGVEMVVTEAADPGSPFAKRGQNVTADYWLHRVNGTLIESTEEGGPFAFVLGTGKGEAGRGGDACRRAAAMACATLPGSFAACRRLSPC